MLRQLVLILYFDLKQFFDFASNVFWSDVLVAFADVIT